MADRLLPLLRRRHEGRGQSMRDIVIDIVSIEILIFVTIGLALGIFYLVILAKDEINEYKAKRKGGERECG